MNSDQNKPIKEYKVSGVRVAIWTNNRKNAEGKVFLTHKIQIERAYKDANGKFKTTSCLDTDDIPKAVLALNKCYEFIKLAEEKNVKESNEEPHNGWKQ